MAVPAYEALRESQETGAEMFEALLRGVSTRNYRQVIPRMADSAGVSKSAVSREAAEAGARQLEQLLGRRWEEVEILVIYLDGMQFGSQHVIRAVGVDREGHKHVLGLQLGATENAAAAKDLLIRLREQGLDTSQRYPFVIDGAKALRAAIDEVFGAQQLVQRCRTHIAGRNPRLPEGWKVPSRASPYEPGSLGSGMAGQLVMSKQIRHVASVPSPEARANVQAVPQGNVWHRHGISNEYYWESSGMGWSSLLCMGEDSSGCGCVGKRSSRHPRCFEQRHERKEA